ncbi:rod shape-determining protein MreC [Pseudogracilibacillus auburnensis]|uniref:Cell shape-determining protein MreC n=1 Tax=Pseudogracilibacillus auburnensis TaxID=1494959 RepID=A0A2V3WCW0_9BACI|nr:rod shape-determining protein MreC [Pseudogracilibacillus auburnensis]MBO1002594.1 rod shape-determining protein MreC [Pseudogracilibacillus auburnensis]PXW86619.1 rod shape-determining protein MreC [Pseudogracilibacillus auburnensis]
MSFFRKKSLFILLIGIILLVVLVGYSLTSRDKLSAPEKFLMDSVGWMQNLIHQPVTFFVDTFHSFDDIKNTYNENKILREKLAEYKTLIYEVQEMEKENEELRKTLDIVDSPRDFEPVLANVISRSPERWLEQITINRGTKHGVRKNMAVMTVDGMIGKVTSESNLTSTVQLITGFDQLNRISAKISREDSDNIFGLIEGYDKEKEALIFRIIEQSDKDLKEDELVVSSNMGGLFPDGLPIGTIKEINPDQYGLTKIAYVEPAANMYEINQVIVVNRALETTDNIEEDEEE